MKLNIRLGQKFGALWAKAFIRGDADPQSSLKGNLAPSAQVKEQLFTEIEELLISADFGVEFTAAIINDLKKNLSTLERDAVMASLKKIIKNNIAAAAMPMASPAENLTAVPIPQGGLRIHLIFGVNGSGKTTTVGKLAFKFRQDGKRVLIAAADTYRDAAIDQLVVWGNRAEVPVIRQQQGSDPGAVVYDACDAAAARNIEELIIDTAGRLHTKENLMEELAKIGRVLDKKMPGVSKIKLLTLDATTGQNAFSQAKLFNEYIGVDGIILAKLDSSSKGGIACAVAGKLGIPIFYAGTGEKIEDLIDFDIDEYLNAVFS